METLMSSCWKIVPLKFREKDRLICRQGDISLNRKENGCPRNQKPFVLMGFSLSVSFHRKTVRSVSVASALSPENQTLVEREETDQILAADQPKTAHIRFKLTKECAFGQHFLVVGDDPCLGFWDPSDGVPFDWSDRHVWTAELNVPCGKVIKYKFILKVDDSTILWQPGADRILETWETEKTIIVFEDWEHPEFQDLAEEDIIADINDAKSLNSDTNYSKHEESSALEQEATVLLPGLIPTLTDETDEESPNKVEDEELKDEHISASLRSTETCKAVMDNENGFYGKQQLEILEGDMRWGRGMLQKFFAILGF